MRARLILDAAKVLAKEIGRQDEPIGYAADCIKIKTNPTLLETDCRSCQERPHCALRAHTVSERLAEFSPRVSYISMLHSWNQVVRFSVSELYPDEITDMASFRAILSEVTSKMEKDLIEIRKRNA